MTDNLVPRNGNCDCPCHFTVGVQHIAACCHPKPVKPVKPHWRTIMAGNIAIAGGYCWCSEPDGDYHILGSRPR